MRAVAVHRALRLPPSATAAGWALSQPPKHNGATEVRLGHRAEHRPHRPDAVRGAQPDLLEKCECVAPAGVQLISDIFI